MILFGSLLYSNLSGNTIILYSSNSLNDPSISGDLADAPSWDSSSTQGIIAIDIDNTPSGMTTSQYIENMTGGGMLTYSNIIVVYHGNPDGSTPDPSMLSTFGANSPVMQQVASEMTPGGLVVVAQCFGPGVDNGQTQALADEFNTPVLTAGPNYLSTSALGITPLSPDPKNNVPGWWVITVPAPKTP